MAQTLHLFIRAAKHNLCTSEQFHTEHIMNEFFILTRVAQALLAVTIVSGIFMATQLALLA